MGTITPISSLRFTSWHSSSIRARVTWKSEVTPWTNGNSSGTIFLINMVDESGEITGVIFNELCPKFYDQLHAGNVYLISNPEVSRVHNDFKILNNPLQILFVEETIVQFISKINIPKIIYNFVPLSAVSKLSDRDPVDAIAICTDVRSVEERGGFYIREIIVMDSTYQKVMLNLWNKLATSLEVDPGDVIVAKGAVARPHNNEIKLNADWFTNVQINPDIPEAIALRNLN
ncbi:replication protein A 70 kDa DNA-binding subunit-like [Drosophila eugracilis]|uniref:replication protein A 70 kDa DNA-binding subunit-like n=1 Tax=Drosophila eugracilis TaxID=29029 RepID=UPI0007E7DF4E|nr:replication protein A 70 kDa DNA-binding subunit-like [Drosophila eugracilis]